MQGEISGGSEPWWKSKVFEEETDDKEGACAHANKASRKEDVYRYDCARAVRPTDASKAAGKDAATSAAPGVFSAASACPSRAAARRAGISAKEATPSVVIIQSDRLLSAPYNAVQTQAFLADGVRTLGDIDHCIFSSRQSPSIFLMHGRNKEEKVSNVILRLLVDADVYEPPLVTHLPLKELDAYYYNRLPTRGLLYSFCNGKMVNLSLTSLQIALTEICRQNCRVKQLKVRYKSHLQPLIEYQQQKKNEKTFEKMQHILFQRATAFTREALMSLLLATSWDMHSKGAYSRAHRHLRLYIRKKLVC